MSARRFWLLGLLGLVGAACAYGSYGYDVTTPLALGYGVYAGGFTENGTLPNWTGIPTSQFASPGSFIWTAAVSTYLVGDPIDFPLSSNDYEVSTTLALAPGGGTYIEYLRASSNALASPGSCVGSYVSLEVVVPTSYVSGGTLATLNMNQCTSGSLSYLGSFQVTVQPGSTFRTVVFGGSIYTYIDNQIVVYWGPWAIPSVTGTTGQPGVGGYGMTSSWGGGIGAVSIGQHDVVAPNPVAATGVRSSIQPNTVLHDTVSLAWQGATDGNFPDNGIGVAGYWVNRGAGASPTTWTALGFSPGAEFGDSTVSPGTTYTYMLVSVDFHGNAAGGTLVTITTPASPAVDPRRVGVFTTGSYWGGGGEQIDMLSGNLNFSLPLVKAQGRPGWTVPVGLSYNSQNWRQDSGYNWELGTDIGYGYGWTLQIGSITPIYEAWPGGVDHYVYADGTGAQYTLTNIATTHIWSSSQGIYVWFDADTQELHFKNGMFWLMGSVSSGAEQDAGTMYPTVIEDTGGNQVIVTYNGGLGLPAGSVNTSGRISTITDVRGGHNFNYSGAAGFLPHLASVTASLVGDPENYFFSYTSGLPLGPPFGYDPSYAGQTTTQLTGIWLPVAGFYAFTYDSAGAEELTKAQFPWGGYLRWTYDTANYAGSRELREINDRYMNSSATGSGTEYGPYPITHSDSGVSGGIPTVHADSTLADASGVGAKKWAFNNTGGSSAWEIGLVSQFTQLASVSGAAITQDTYTWAQAPTSMNPYISPLLSG